MGGSMSLRFFSHDDVKKLATLLLSKDWTLITLAKELQRYKQADLKSLFEKIFSFKSRSESYADAYIEFGEFLQKLKSQKLGDKR